MLRTMRELEKRVAELEAPPEAKQQ
jgi:hypothetical protein